MHYHNKNQIKSYSLLNFDLLVVNGAYTLFLTFIILIFILFNHQLLNLLMK